MKNKQWDTLVVGAGAAGCMAAITAARQGQRVLLLEKNEKIGKKLYITGKGRCNLTNASELQEILENIPVNAKFLFPALYALPSHQLMAFFENAGCPLKVERGNRVFPVSDKSSDVIRALEKQLALSGVSVQKKELVKGLLLQEMDSSERKAAIKATPELLPAEGGDQSGAFSGRGKQTPNIRMESMRRVMGVCLANGEMLTAGRVILATGGLAYPATGSTGDGYRFAEQAGHSIEALVPGLVPIETVEQDFSELSPLLLKNVVLQLAHGKKILFAEQGELQFTPYGLGGALVLSAASYLPKTIVPELRLRLDLKPALSHAVLEARIERELSANPAQPVEAALVSLLPYRMWLLFLKRCGIDPQKPAAQISKREKKAVAEGLKNLEFHIRRTRDFKEAIITRGGIRLKEVNPSTMESRLVKGLFFAGEMLDIDALTGGFNLQIAFSTGYLAGIQPVI